MKFKEKDIDNIEFFKMLYNDETFRSMYKYFSTISVDESDVQNYITYLKRCEEFGLSFYIYYMDSDRDSLEMVVFSNFEIKEMPESDLIDLTFFDTEWINRYFCKIFREDGYFIVSDHTLKNNSLDGIVFKDISDKKAKRDISQHLRLLKQTKHPTESNLSG